jgi:hypothetical protein
MVNRPALAPKSDSQSAPIVMWAVFSNDTDIGFLKILKHGYRHCFIIMQQDARWVIIDPRADKTDIQILPHPPHFNFPRYLTEQGKTVVKISNTFKTPRKIASILPISCVETLKRVIGLHQWWVLTPHQLYRALLKIQKKGS